MMLRLLVFSALLGVSANAQESAHGKLVAVLEFNTKLEGAEKKAVDTQYLADTVRAAILDTVPDLRVMTRENVMVLLEQNGKKLSDCEGECEVDTGRRLGADLVISGDLLKFGTAYKLNLKMHDTHGGRLLAGAQASGHTIDQLDASTQEAVRKLLRPLNNDTSRSTPGAAAQTSPEVMLPIGPPPAPAAQKAAHPPRLTIGTSSDKAFDISVRAGKKVIACPARVTASTPCELNGVPPGPITLVVGGDATQEHDFTLPGEDLRIMIDSRGKWPVYLGGGLIAGGALFLLGGTQIVEPAAASQAYAFGIIFVASGVGLAIFGVKRSPISYNETTGEARLDRDPGIRQVGLGLGPVPGGAMASAALSF